MSSALDPLSFPTLRVSGAIGSPEPRRRSRRLPWTPAFAGMTDARIDTLRVMLWVMAGLVPAIHAAPLLRHWRWATTSPLFFWRSSTSRRGWPARGRP